jgi:hypothetical protein
MFGITSILSTPGLSDSSAIELFRYMFALLSGHWLLGRGAGPGPSLRG